jgi:outer membrane receptor protein involved in Fe transport
MTVLAAPVLAQEAGAPAGETGTGAASPGSGEEIVVVAERLKEQIDAPQPPVVVYDEEDIAAFGASSIADLITAAAPQTNSGRGRGSGFPLILVNGQRISNFREIRNIPPEAIRRMEVLPEEVALRFGYPPDQRVINIILKDHFAAKSLTAEYHFPTLGGFDEKQFGGTMLRIENSNRINIYARFNEASPLTEAERGVAQQPGTSPTVAGDSHPASARTLIADTKDYVFNVSWNKGLGEKGMDGSLGINAGFQRDDSRSLSGLNTVVLTDPAGASATRTFGSPLTVFSRTDNYQAGAVLNKQFGSWKFTGTLDSSHAITDTFTDLRADTSALSAAAAAGTLAITGPLPAAAPGTIRQAHIENNSVAALLTLNGRPLHPKAGDVSLTVKTGFAYTGIRSDNSQSSSGATRLGRGDLSAGINLAIPLTSRKNHVLSALGDVTLNLSAGLDRLSDFGTLTDWSAGVTWALTDRLSFQASYIDNQAAPSLANLGNPSVVTFNVPVYDFTRGATALVTTTTGGNPSLVREEQRDLKLSATWQLPFLRNSNLIVEYFHNRSNNVTNAFPLLTPAIEAAFPGRVTRDASGRLVAIDQRPITLAETNSSRLRWGFNLSGNIGKPQARGRSGMFGGMYGGRGGFAGGAGPRPGGTGQSPGGRGGYGPAGGPGRNGQGRWNLSIYHTVRFIDRVLIAPGIPELNLLGGDALTGSGSAHHGIEIEGGGTYRGIGLRLTGNWAAPTHVRGSGLPGSSDLRFGSTFKLDLRTFVDFNQKPRLLKSLPFLKGARLAIEVENLFDSRQRVTDANGIVPLSYQPDLIDPRGRVIQLDFRKMF